ncbi:helix-turn-helix domain-containing protein [Streptomyces purpureus]|uniref:helix-turn-helix domain-containing protein n=1 Tax=Streptomyces purpureus TaxID=1951 RepID=UPI0037A27BF8
MTTTPKTAPNGRPSTLGWSRRAWRRASRWQSWYPQTRPAAGQAPAARQAGISTSTAITISAAPPAATSSPARRRRLRAALGPAGADGADLAAARAELVTLAPAAPALDARVAHALREIGRPGHDTAPAAVAAEVGLSPVRLRALVRASVGVPLVRLRQWGRLRGAVAALAQGSVASAAATAGFADQAHLARAARDLLGRTPSSLVIPRRGRSNDQNRVGLAYEHRLARKWNL